MAARAAFRFGTKAETLAALVGRVETARIPPLHYFTVGDWKRDAAATLAVIRRQFGDAALAVRSSALVEDAAHTSHAGAFTSLLSVAPDDQRRAAAIDEVAASYAGNPRDQVLVQPMLADVAVSGVMTTRSLADGGPYFEINYDDFSGRTDTITGGVGANKTVVIHRSAPERFVGSARVQRWLRLGRELERLCGEVPLDIEFVEDRAGELWLLQVRRISAARQWDPRVAPSVDALLPPLATWVAQLSAPRTGVLGKSSILGEMPDWNPAEIIGTSPRPLAASLYRLLITDRVWSEARTSMGYRALDAVPLLVLLSGRPFIDVRASFNSFLPAALDESIGAKLIDAWLARLADKPELHDKVEFEVAKTSFDFTFDADLDARYPHLLSVGEREAWRESLRALTQKSMSLDPQGSLARSMEAAQQLAARQERRAARSTLQGLEALHGAARLLDEAIELGTRPFAVAARHAFIADAFLRSAVVRGALSADRLLIFRRSVQTIAGEMSKAARAVVTGALPREKFMARFGHLRPGTYDVLSARYDQREDLFEGVDLPPATEEPRFELTESERAALTGLLTEAKLSASPAALLEFASQAIIAREWVKFVFTRNLSDALELLAGWADGLGLTREELSYLPIDALLKLRVEPILPDARAPMSSLAAENEAASRVSRGLRLNYLVRDERDLYVVPLHRSAPNFVTAKQIEARTVHLNATISDVPDLFGAIVCIENADPGYDWIFLRGIAGLITRFGGANSHMAIRCAEFGLPAAIGCGEQTFERCVRAGRVDLNCAERRVRPIHGNDDIPHS